ncbi:MAG TPA: RagB/SusD family nutrient uptake outer membrane protein [Puia sp.]|nr:RagB/SusD family nutrient uptake outer membrane protein [Puia sp.]
MHTFTNLYSTRSDKHRKAIRSCKRGSLTRGSKHRKSVRQFVLVTGACCALVLGGCKKYLSTTPDNRTSLDTPEKVAQLLGTAYPQVNYMAFTESISDNVNDKGIGGLDLTVLNPFFFQDVSDNQQDSPEWYWDGCYAAIAAANEALQACRNAPDTALYSSEIGEALLARAYAHFMLVTIFSNCYDSTTAATDPGIPYVTVPENVVFKQYDRKTVSYVYDMIERDITEGLPLLDDTRYTVPRYHFTRAAAHAFAARFYLFKRNYARVVEHAGQVLPSGDVTTILRPWNTTYMTITYVDLYARYARATEAANLLLVETSSLWARNYYTERYGMDASKRTEILNYNVTGGQYAFLHQLFTVGTNNYLLPKINEYFVKQSVNATIGTPYVMVPILTSEEVLFNRVEANIYLNNTTAALADLNAYASTRIYNYDPVANQITPATLNNYYGTGSPQADLLDALMDFKRAEYVQEGMRWFDLLRYKVPVTHTTTTGQKMTLTATDKRRLFQIPQSATLSGLALNPR